MSACVKCGAAVGGKFCPDCGAPNAVAAGPPVARPRGSATASVVKAPFAPGTAVEVEDGFEANGIMDLGARLDLSNGDRIDGSFLAVVFVRKAGFTAKLDATVGRVFDATNVPRDVHLKCFVQVKVDDPAQLFRVLGDKTQLEDEPTRVMLQPILVAVARGVVTQRFASHAWNVAMFEQAITVANPALLEFGRLFSEAYKAAPDRLGGTKITPTAPTFEFPAVAGVAAPPMPVVAPAMVMGPASRVLVQWSDGQRYPGTVRENRGDQILVEFPNGAANWIPRNFVFPT